MTDETLSALFDGECSADELDRVLDRIEKDPSLAEQYSRMVLAQAAQSSRFSRSDSGFSARVMAALEADEQPSESVVVSLTRRSSRLEKIWRPAVGLAMAAGLGAVAVLALQPSTLQSDAPVNVAVAEQPIAAPTEVAQRQWDQLEPADSDRLNAYLIAYGQSRAQQGMGSTLGYARFAAHTAEYRPQRMQGPTARASDARDIRR